MITMLEFSQAGNWVGLSMNPLTFSTLILEMFNQQAWMPEDPSSKSILEGGTKGLQRLGRYSDMD